MQLFHGTYRGRPRLFSYFTVAVLALVALALAATAGAAQLIDRIVAVVNDDVITASELEQNLERSIQKLRQQTGPGQLPPRQVLRRQLLERMVIDRIQIQRAKERDIQVSAQEVDDAVARVARQNNLGVPRFRQALKRQGVDYADYRQRLKEQIMRSRLSDGAVRSKIHITEEEVDSYLARQGKSGEDQFEYKLQHILVAVPEGTSPEETAELRRKAEDLRARVTEGEAFATVAAAESDGQNALEGGDLGWFKPGELPEPVLAEVEAVEPGHLSRVVRTPSGFHVFRVTERRRTESARETQVKARHILLRTDSGRSPQQARARAAQIKRRLEQGASFAQLARQFSEGPSSGEGGNLGWVSRGEMAPEFEEALFSLSEGEIGGPVRTQFGVHIAQVLETRERAIDSEKERKQARQALRNRKTRERMEQWQRRLRAQAFVDIRLDDQEASN
ncbi:peptidylprolyl isomerase [Thiohalorhabdus sp.]|uniref:peptidylprolyl isomerase n=1 Tax=Thiohalorhabdus sp. TaxID=3094134 RepID=UPI002FC3D3BE